MQPKVGGNAMKLKKLKCVKCGHEWIPRKEDVRQCPKCKTAYWAKSKKK